MDIPLQITFRNMDRSEAVEARIRERAEKLETYFARLTSCRVMVEAPERPHHRGGLYHVRIELGVPGKELVVNHHPGNKPAHDDVYVAVRDAFNIARRRLQDWARRLERRDKIHGVARPIEVGSGVPEKDKERGGT